jgi:hypothetical protein
VPFFGTGASEQLPLKTGSCLVLRFDRATLQSGQVNPTEVIKLIKNGVEVHACANLHAKVFVFKHTSFIGSTNVSTASEHLLIEACVEVRAKAFADKCRTFVKSLRGDVVGLDFAKRMKKHYRPPQSNIKRSGKSKRLIPTQSNMWLVSLVEKPLSDFLYDQEEAGWSAAERALSNPKKAKIETFLWDGEQFLKQLKLGERIIMNTKVDKNKCLVSPPGRVLNVKTYHQGKSSGRIIYLEVPKNKRRKNQLSFVKSLGPLAKSLGHPRRTKQLRNSELVYRLGKIFA